MSKGGVNEKVQDARDRKAGAKKAAAEAAAKAQVRQAAAAWMFCRGPMYTCSRGPHSP